MGKPRRTFFALLGAILISFALTGLAMAQTESLPSPAPVSTSDINTEAIVLPDEQESVSAQQLGVKEPKLLPNNKLYFLKEWQRKLKFAFTFDPLKKADLQQGFVNEKLVELKALAEKTKNADVINKAIISSQKEIGKLKIQVEKIKETAQTNPEVNQFLEKFTEQNLLQQRLLQKLETQVPPQVFEKIEQARQEHLENFSAVMQKLEDKEKIPERIQKALEKQKDAKFKPLEDLKFLRTIGEKLPQEAKEAMQKIEEQKIQEMKQRLQSMSEQDQSKMADYFLKAEGDKEKQLELLQTIKTEIKDVKLQEKLEQAKEKIVEKIEQLPQKPNCPAWIAPVPGFCKEGRIVILKDPATGCLLSAKCVVAEETKKNIRPGICITLWNPVCGSDNKTYSNDCFAKSSGVEIDYQGVCREGIKPVSPAFPEQPSETKQQEQRGVDTEKVK